MEFEILIQLISNVGFPMAIALILLQTILIKFNKQMEGLEKRLEQLNKTIKIMIDAINTDKISEIPQKSNQKRRVNSDDNSRETSENHSNNSC